MRSKKLVEATVRNLLLLISTSTVLMSTNVIAADTEKCYGIVKKGMNDCQTATQSCAGSSTKNKQRDAYIFLPKGACSKIVGSSLVASDKQRSKK